MGRIILVIAILAILALAGVFNREQAIEWSAQERAQMRNLILPDPETLKAQVKRPGNAYWQNEAAIALGEALFFDPRLSGNGKVACATCHQPDKAFTDGKVLSEGIAVAKRHAPSLIGIATSPWFFWDGRADSLWAQALGPLEDSAEQGSNRMQLARLIGRFYSAEYVQIFGSLPDFSDEQRYPQQAMPVENIQRADMQRLDDQWQAMRAEDQRRVNIVFANIGKSLAAYQSQLLPMASRFDLFAKAVLAGETSELLTREEQKGLKLFLDDSKSQCMRCHNGPLFTSHDFAITGIRDIPEPVGLGRLEGIQKILKSPFNCMGTYSDTPDQCAELRYTKRQGEELRFAFKVPTLRNIAQTAPYMHTGSFQNLAGVLHYYNRAKSRYPDATSGKARHLDVAPLRLASRQLQQIEAFLKTLSSLPGK